MSLCSCQHCDDPLCSLTNRERELLDLLVIHPGATNRELGHMMYISRNTVKKHLRNIYRTFSVSRRSQAILHYLQYIETATPLAESMHRDDRLV